MPYLDTFTLGLILAGSGLGFWFLTHLLTRSAVPDPADGLVQTETGTDQGDAVLVIQSGGRVLSMNEKARQLFHVRAGEPLSLERLSHHARPMDVFLGLCASGQQARFVLDGRMVDASSYRLAVRPLPLTVVSLREPGLTASLADGGLSAETVQTFVSATQAMAASLDLLTTLQTILENIEKLVPADWMEITLWDPTQDALVPYRLTGLEGGDRKLDVCTNHYRLDEGYSGLLARERRPVLVEDVSQRTDVQPVAPRAQLPLCAYLGVPLMMGKEFIGTLELASKTPGVFHAEDLQVIRMMSGQAAIAIHNALMYESEHRRTAELSGLAQLSQAFGAARDPNTIFARLVESILPLIQVKVLGFLLYHETQRTLEAQAPFHGFPDEFLELYHAVVPPSSTLEQAMLDQDVLISEDAANDPQWEKLGLGSLARGGSLRETVLIPLSSGGRMLGYLQASNHSTPGSVFNQDELHLLVIVANQAAPVIDNFTLIQQSRQRARRAESLRRIASLASSAANLDEILSYSLQELGRLLEADVAAVFLTEPDGGPLRLHRRSLFGSAEAPDDALCCLPLDDPQFHFTVARSQRSIFSPSLTEDQAVIPFYRAIQTAWGIESVMIVPLIVRDEGIGEIWLASREGNFFDKSSLPMVATAAGQLAGVVEQAHLAAQTDESLRRRVEQLSALTRVNRELSTSVDLRYLLQIVFDEALLTTKADCGSIVLFDLNRPSPGGPRTRFYIGEQPAAELCDLEKQALESGIALNLGDAEAKGYTGAHPGICSALIVPIIYQQKPAGLMVLHAHDPQRFDATAQEISQSLAVQAAVVLGNSLQAEQQARQGEALKRELDTLSTLFDVTRTLRPDVPLEQHLEAIGQAICGATPFQTVVISVYEPGANCLQRRYGAGLNDNDWAALRSHTQPWSAIRQLLQPQYQVGSAYYIPADLSVPVPEEIHAVAVLPELHSSEPDAWDANDILLLPLFDPDDRPVGLISVDAPRDGHRPDWQTFKTLDLFALQASVILRNYLTVSGMETKVAQLKGQVADLAKETEEARTRLPALLAKESEQSAVLQTIQRQIERTQNGVEIADVASQQTDPQAVLQSVVSELLTRFDLQVGLIAERTPAGPVLMDVMGEPPEGVNLRALFGARNPLRQVLQDGQVALVNDLTVCPEWQDSVLLTGLGARSFLGLPFVIDDQREVAILVAGTAALPAFSDEDRQSINHVARQVSVALQNMDLLTSARHQLAEMDTLLGFSRKLGSLDPLAILRTLLESALQIIPAAQAGWAGLCDSPSDELLPQVALGYAESDMLLGMHLAGTDHFAGLAEGALPLPLRAFQAGRPQRVQEVQFSRDYNLPPDDLMRYRRATGGRLPVATLALPVRLGQSILGVLVLENFNSPEQFDEADENLALSLAQQTALALENAHLLQAAQQRAVQLQALTHVAGKLTASLRTEDLIASLLLELNHVLAYDTATLWLRKDQELSVAAVRGFDEGSALLGLSVRVEDSQLFKEMLSTGNPICVPDIRQDGRFPSLVEPERVSWLGIPLVVQSELTGVIAIDKVEPGFYGEELVQIAATFAGQAAVALENARLFEESEARAAELDQRSRRLALLNRLSGDLATSLDADYILKQTVHELASALNITGAAAVLLDEQHQYRLTVEISPRKTTLPQLLAAAPIFKRLEESRGVFFSNALSTETELTGLYEDYLQPRGAESLLMVPLLAGAELHGWLLLFDATNSRFSLPEIELARTITNQAAAAIQNARLFAETRSLTEDLERRVADRTAEVTREHQNSQTLLRIISELSASLDMDLVLNRTLMVLNETLGAEQSVIALTSGSLKTYQAGDDLAGIRATGGKLGGVNQEIARWVVRRRTPALIKDAGQDTRWTAPTGELAYRSVLAVPLALGEDVLGSLLLYHRQAGVFSQEQVRTLEAAARQISISISNADLFNLIRDQAENLGGMLREQQVEASRSRGILEAVADGVLVTDAHNSIYLFNASAGRILDLDAKQILGQSLDHFSGLFGKAAAAWMQTIRSWSADPLSYRDGQTYAEQLELDNGRVVSVHLAPVIMGREFLGTVSIFRDITHQVQVDRLKSEFVANVSHELRTPMTSIKGYVDVMLMGAAGELDPRLVHFLGIVKSNAERLNVLVNDLLDVSKIESGRVMLSMQALDMNEIAKDVIADFNRRAQADQRPMIFNLDIPEDLPRVDGDHERVRQVVSNMMSNAYNYTPAGGEVWLRMSTVGEEVQVDVQDNGIGILPRDQHRVFERFFRGEDPLVLACAGTGLGLSITRSLIEMHGGRIWFSSSGVPGEGSVFSFTLPVHRPSKN